MITDKELHTMLKVIFLVTDDYRKRNTRRSPEEKQVLLDFLDLCDRVIPNKPREQPGGKA